MTSVNKLYALISKPVPVPVASTTVDRIFFFFFFGIRYKTYTVILVLALMVQGGLCTGAKSENIYRCRLKTSGTSNPSR